MEDLEGQLKIWAQPPSKAQEQRCQNAETMIRNAINASTALKHRNITIFGQGSYFNNTNTARNSDVDIGVVCNDTIILDYPDGMSKGDFGLIAANYGYADFKNEVGEALVSYFQGGTVTRGNKAFDIKATSYHVEADVAAFFEHRRYSTPKSCLEGVALQTDKKNTQVVNWPEQHKVNGIKKNNATGRRFKRLVRIVKSANDLATNPVPGFLLECLMWNVPNNNYKYVSYEQTLRLCLSYLKPNLDMPTSDKWVEVSELKYLFRYNSWTKAEAKNAVLEIWNKVGL